MNNKTNRPTETGSLIPAATSHKGAILWNELQRRGSIYIQTQGEAFDAIASDWRNRIEKEPRNQTVVVEYRLMTRKS